MNIYLSGPMTGYPDLNRAAFEAAVLQVQDCWPDASVVNPHDLNHNHDDLDHPLEYFYRIDLGYLIQCDAVVVLQGWQQSRGARLEVFVALQLGMPVYELDGTTIRVALDLNVRKLG